MFACVSRSRTEVRTNSKTPLIVMDHTLWTREILNDSLFCCYLLSCSNWRMGEINIYDGDVYLTLIRLFVLFIHIHIVRLYVNITAGSGVTDVNTKVMTNLDSIFKSRDITWPTKFRLVKAMVFPVVMYGCESWTVKKAERQRIDAFEMWCWRKLLRVPWTARRSNQFILKEISPGISLEGMMLKLKLQYFGHLMQRVDSLEKTLMLGGIGAGGEGDDRG